MPFNTRNPVPSGDLRDLDDNARNIDTWANDKTKTSHPDRFGVERYTWHGIEQEAQLNIQQAIDAKNAAQEAAMMSGFSKYADTLAQLEAGIGTDYIEGDVVIVFQDEIRGGTSSIYKVESGVAVFKNAFDKTRQDLLSFTGNISADAEWSDVPAHSDPAFDVQAHALANRVEWLKERSKVFVTPEMFGGRASDAIQAAMVVASYAQVPVILSSGETYTISRTVSSKPCVIQGDGGVATIVCDNLNGVDAIAFDPADVVGAKGGLIGVNIVVQGSPGGKFLSMPKAADQYNFYFTRWEFRDIYGRGSVRNTDAYSFCWDYGFETWFRLSDCAGLEFEHVVIQGQYDIQQDPSTQFHDCAIDLDAAGGILTARIDDVTFGPIHTPFKWGNRAFFSLSNFDFIGAHNGIFMYGTESAFNEPKIGPGNINAQQYGIYLDGPDTIDFNSVTIRRHRRGWKGATWDWHGIYAAGVSDGRIRACTAQPDEGGGEFSGTMHAYTLKDCALGAFAENFVGPGCDVGVLLDNCTGFNVDNTISAQNKTTDVLFKLTNDTRRMTIGEYALVSSFAGTVVEKDSTITQPVSMRNDMPDHQSTGNITQDWTRTSAAADSKKWRQVISATQRSQQVVNDAGSATNYHLVTRSGSTVTAQEFRGSDIFLNGGTTRVNLFRPAGDNEFSCGTTNYRFTQICAATGTINTSDEREKQQWRNQSEAEKAAALEIKRAIRAFKFTDAVNLKGEFSRWHFGVGAQTVGDILRRHGLNPDDYAFWCYDEWDEQPEVKDEEGNITQEHRPSGNRYGIRYDELAMFILAAI